MLQALRYLTRIELVSRQLQWDDCQQCPTRDRQTVEIVSDRLLSTAEVNTLVSLKYGNDYVVVGVYEMDYNAAPAEF